MKRKTTTVAHGRKYAVPALRKFLTGAIVKPNGPRGKGKKWMVTRITESDFYTDSHKHTYYRCQRGKWFEFFRSDQLDAC